MIYTVTLNPALDRELTVPCITYNSVLRADELRLDLGGKGFNVSRTLAALNTPSIALGFVGGLTGQRFAPGLAELGIQTDFVEIAGETRTNVSLVSTNEDHHLKVNEAGPSISPDEEAALFRKVSKLATTGDWWVLSGSLPPGVTVDLYARLTEVIQSQGGRVILDTSGPPLKAACEAGPYLAKPNDVEATELTGIAIDGPAGARAAATAIRRLGVSVVLISLGKRGAFLFDGERAMVATPPNIIQKNPIGAGDAMVGGLVGSLSKGDSPFEALRQGVASGAATASLNGTAVGSITQVQKMAAQVALSDYN